MTDLTTSTAGLASSGLGRLQSMQSLIWRTSVALGTESPEKVSSNFINMLKSAGPLLNGITTLIVPWAMLITAFYRYDWLCRAAVSVKEYLVGFLYASISIPGDHALNQPVLRWVLDEGAKSQIRTLALLNPVDNSRWTLNGLTVRGKMPVHYQGMASVTEENNAERILSYVPDIGRYSFYFGGHRMVLERKRSEAQILQGPAYDQHSGDKKQQETALKISCFSLWSGAQPIQALLAHVEAEIALARENKTSIYRPRSDHNGWDNGLPRAARTLDAVTLQTGVKEALIQDVESYLHPKTKKYYGARGIPWRRGYLFYGPPGTGKTSLAQALAGQFQLNVYMISLSSQLLNDSRLDALFDMLPQKCTVLLEDIDSAGIRREDMSGETKEKKKKKKRTPMPNPFGFPVNEDPEGVTLSGLLNVIDGVFLKSKEELLEHELARDEAEVVYMAGQFAEQFAEYTFTPAEVQGYLIDHRADAAKAVREAKAYFEEVQATKTKGFDMMDGKEKVSADPAEDAPTDPEHVEKTSPSTPESSKSMVVVDEEAKDKQC
ncbi:hypothetical protein LTR97_000898 [Elasticomyces elasticus]|uniref:AAA+ ATPase domain-containing protein n=1 Tax=Elasticomyces elasticus TaxID=574655 RepID=A0AAN7WHX3_9PEZI|nr:hypothetical protein LTR97_000898 [Elasticomyces elasticus]